MDVCGGMASKTGFGVSRIWEAMLKGKREGKA